MPAIDYPVFSLPMQVRDYECDLQGIVNNGVYFNYFEHARHQYLQRIGIDFAQLTKSGVHLVVVRAELDYKQSLQPDDHFRVCTAMTTHSRVKLLFSQRIELLQSKFVDVNATQPRLIAAGYFYGVALRQGRAQPIQQLLQALA